VYSTTLRQQPSHCGLPAALRRHERGWRGPGARDARRPAAPRPCCVDAATLQLASARPRRSPGAPDVETLWAGARPCAWRSPFATPLPVELPRGAPGSKEPCYFFAAQASTAQPAWRGSCAAGRRGQRVRCAWVPLGSGWRAGASRSPGRPGGFGLCHWAGAWVWRSVGFAAAGSIGRVLGTRKGGAGAGKAGGGRGRAPLARRAPHGRWLVGSRSPKSQWHGRLARPRADRCSRFRSATTPNKGAGRGQQARQTQPGRRPRLLARGVFPRSRARASEAWQESTC
jgi:hypothetical protein